MSIGDIEDSIFQISQMSDKQMVNLKPKEMPSSLALKRRQTRININEGHKNDKLAFERSQLKD